MNILESKYPFELPEIGYGETGLQGFLSPHQINVHHQKHHSAYVSNANKYIGERTDLQNKTIKQLLREYSSDKTILNNIGQHYNHCFFWLCLSSLRNIETQGLKVVDEITSQYGSMDEFKKYFKGNASTFFGSGWTYLYKEGEKLKIGSYQNANSVITDVSDGVIPLLTIDTWEHAWYIDYENVKNDYFDNFWFYVNWSFVNEQYLIDTTDEEL